MSALWADTLLRNEGNGLPRQCAHWLAMTVVFDTFRTKTGANVTEELCHCEEPSQRTATWQSVLPASAGCSATKGRRIPLHRQTINYLHIRKSAAVFTAALFILEHTHKALGSQVQAKGAHDGGKFCLGAGGDPVSHGAVRKEHPQDPAKAIDNEPGEIPAPVF